MAGVPSGRGCVACRAKKKKCDEGQPACGRCVRLMIKCIGSGIRRFKFKNENIQSVQGKALVTTAATPTTPTPRLALATETTRIGGALVSILELKDVNYDIFMYGPFLDQLPRRLGSSPAVDAAVKAIVASFTAIRNKTPQTKALAYYGKALSTLRQSLKDPAEACTPNTMCAIYLAQVCKEWMGGTDTISPKHGGILMHLMRQAAAQGRLHEFDPNLLDYILSTIVTESFWNHDIEFDQNFLDIFNQISGPRPLNTGSIVTVLPEILVELSIYIREPGKYVEQIRNTYDMMQSEHEPLRIVVQQWREQAAQPNATLLAKQIAVRYNFIYGLFMAQGLIVNRILRMYDNDPKLVTESCELCDKVTVQAREAASSRPFAAFFAPKALMSAWAALTDPVRLREIESILAEYQTDFEEGMDYLNNAKIIKRAFAIMEMRLNSGRIGEVEVSEEDIVWCRDSMEGVSECIILKPFGKHLLQGDALEIRSRSIAHSISGSATSSMSGSMSPEAPSSTDT